MIILYRLHSIDILYSEYFFVAYEFQIPKSLSPISDFEFSFPITFQDVKYEVYVKTRPYFKEFLQQMASIYEIIIFTASKKVCIITYY